MAHTNVRPAAHAITAVSFGCLLAQLPWLGFCYLVLRSESPSSATAGVSWQLIACAGSVLLALTGSVLALLGVRNHVAGLVALVLNALVCLAAGVIPLMTLLR